MSHHAGQRQGPAELGVPDDAEGEEVERSPHFMGWTLRA
jgi:hypothetical protein